MSTSVNFVRIGHREERTLFGDSHRIAQRLRPVVSMSTSWQSAKATGRSRHLLQHESNLERQVHDVGIGLELVDGGNAEGVER